MGGGRGMRAVDERALREMNAQAPKVPDLGKRVLELFRPYRKRVAVTALLVVLGAALGAIPPLVIQKVFDEALFPPSGEPSGHGQEVDDGRFAQRFSLRSR